MLTLLSLFALQTCATTDSLPLRSHQPRAFDPGLDGGVDRSFSRGEFTPDGRLLVAFRRVYDPSYPLAFRTALTVSVTRPENLLPTGTGDHLDAFYSETTGFSPPSTTSNPFGSDFAFGAYESGTSDDWALIHYGNELMACGNYCQIGYPCYPCIPGCPTGSMTTDMRLNSYYPLSDSNGSAHMTVGLQTLTTPNPYPSDASGGLDVSGDYTTYQLWVVRTHQRGYEGTHTCNTNAFGSLIKPSGFGDSILVGQKLRVTIHEPTQTVASTHVARYKELKVAGTNAPIEAIEPSITADGRLILFHGNGIDPNFGPGDAVVTYIFNPDGCKATGWTPPRPITTLPDQTELGGMSIPQFQQTYKLFAQPIQMPASAMSATAHEYQPDENITGTYPWVSKDGSFYNAYSVRSEDALDPDGSFSTRTKSGAYVCGDLTNWTIKHIDDIGLNPTREGGPWAWPRYKNFVNTGYPNSWGAITSNSTSLT